MDYSSVSCALRVQRRSQGAKEQSVQQRRRRFSQATCGNSRATRQRSTSYWRTAARNGAARNGEQCFRWCCKGLAFQSGRELRIKRSLHFTNPLEECGCRLQENASIIIRHSA